MDESKDAWESSRLLAESLGRVVQAAASLEGEMRTVAAALLDSKYAAIVVAGQSASWLLETIKAVAKAHDAVNDERQAELELLIPQIKRAFELRNGFAHGIWGTAQDGAIMSHSSRTRRIHWQKTPVTREALDDTAADFRRLATSLRLWVMNALPREAISNEVQLRWEEYLRSLSPEEIARLAARRSEGS